MALGVPRADAAAGPRRRAGADRAAPRARCEPRRRRPSRAAGDLRRLVAALRAAAGAACSSPAWVHGSPLLIGGRRDRWASRCCCPPSGWLTPPGTLRLAAGVPAADPPARPDDLRVLRRRRLHPAPAPDVARHAAHADRHRVHGRRPSPGRRARGCRRGGSTATGRGGSSPSGSPASPSAALLTLPVVLAGAPPEITILTWVAPGHRHGVHVLGGHARGAARGGAARAGERDVVAAARATSWARRSATGVAGAIIAAGTRAGPHGLGSALAAVFALSIGAAVLGVLASGRVGTFGHCPRTAGSAAVD